MGDLNIEQDRWKIWAEILERAEQQGDPEAVPKEGPAGMGNHLAWYERAIAAVGEARETVWGTMIYACAGARPVPGGGAHGCGWEHRVQLGVGCEGPTNLKDMGCTIPVPFFCGSCPKCGGNLMHDRWNEDEDFRELRALDPEKPHFLVPTEEKAKDHAAHNYGGADYEDPTGETTKKQRA